MKEVIINLKIQSHSILNDECANRYDHEKIIFDFAEELRTEKWNEYEVWQKMWLFQTVNQKAHNTHNPQPKPTN